MSLIGNTIKLVASFEQFNGQAADPSSLMLKIYNTDRELIQTIATVQAFRVTTGVYEVPFTVPDGDGDLIYEFSGAVEGHPVIVRGVIQRKWV